MKNKCMKRLWYWHYADWSARCYILGTFRKSWLVWIRSHGRSHDQGKSLWKLKTSFLILVGECPILECSFCMYSVDLVQDQAVLVHYRGWFSFSIAPRMENSWSGSQGPWHLISTCERCHSHEMCCKLRLHLGYHNRLIFQWKEVLHDVRRQHYHILSDLSWAHQHVMVCGYQGHLVNWWCESWKEMIDFYGKTWFGFYVRYQLWHEGQSGVDMWTIGAQVSSGLFSSQNGLGLSGHGSVRLEKVLDDGHFFVFWSNYRDMVS